jgi:hypothetical protein
MVKRRKESYRGSTMPCRNEGAYQQDIANFEAELDKLTAYLCAAFEQLSMAGCVERMPVEAQKWWHRHQEWDRRRIKEEHEVEVRKKLKLEALGKLTPLEKELLGLK